jgi:hypothetical protein
VLPEHASVYYSPRPPPVATEHPTLEAIAVKLDVSVDPRLADTHRVSVDGLEPPPWLGPGSAAAHSPTVLLPAVRARRARRRVVASAIAATMGAAAGVWFGLSDVSRPVEGSSASPPVLVATAAPVVTSPAATAPLPAPPSSPLAAAETPATALSALPVSAPASSSPHSVSQRKTASSAWIHDEHPKAWLK